MIMVFGHNTQKKILIESVSKLQKQKKGKK